MSQENSKASVIKIAVAELKLGMYVSKLDKDWTQSSFLFQGFLIEEQAQIQQLKHECSYVYVDAEKETPPPAPAASPHATQTTQSGVNLESKNQPPPPVVKKRENTQTLTDIVQQKTAARQKPPEKIASFSHEMGGAKLAYHKTSAVVKNVIAEVKEGGNIDGEMAEQAVHDCMESMLRSPDAMMLTMNLKGKHLTTWHHCMNVSVLAISLGRHLNVKDEDLVTLGLAGMFHDIGTLLIPPEELAKAGDKRELIQSHTTLGYELLAQCSGQLGAVVADVAHYHHENLDGSGFPQGLQDEQISAFTRIISIVDFYDTLTSDKVNGQKGLNHYEAMLQLFKRVSAKHFDENLVQSFNQCIGTYPVGSLVELNSGEIAMVVEENIQYRLKPIVMLLTTADKHPCSKQLINLAKSHIDGRENTYAIKRMVRADDYVLDI